MINSSKYDQIEIGRCKKVFDIVKIAMQCGATNINPLCNGFKYLQFGLHDYSETYVHIDKIFPEESIPEAYTEMNLLIELMSRHIFDLSKEIDRCLDVLHLMKKDRDNFLEKNNDIVSGKRIFLKEELLTQCMSDMVFINKEIMED